MVLQMKKISLAPLLLVFFLFSSCSYALIPKEYFMEKRITNIEWGMLRAENLINDHINSYKDPINSGKDSMFMPVGLTLEKRDEKRNDLSNYVIHLKVNSNWQFEDLSLEEKISSIKRFALFAVLFIRGYMPNIDYKKDIEMGIYARPFICKYDGKFNVEENDRKMTFEFDKEDIKLIEEAIKYFIY
jgi:hypothetical protein